MSEPSGTPPPPSKAQVFLRRSLSTAVLWTVILAALFSGNRFISDGVFILLVALLALAGLVEFYGIAEKRGMASFKISGVVGGLLLMVGTFLNLTGHLGTSGSPARVTVRATVSMRTSPSSIKDRGWRALRRISARNRANSSGTSKGLTR